MEDGALSQSALVDFIYREARLLDEKRFDEWYELLTDDVLYWMPLTRGQPRDDVHTSLFYEDRLLLKVRIERLRHPNAFSNSSRVSASTFCSNRRWRRAITAPGGTSCARRSCMSKRSWMSNSCWLASRTIIWSRLRTAG